VRPDDLKLVPDTNGAATVEWSKYEDGTLLYGLHHPQGANLRVLVSHELSLAPGDRATSTMVTTHPLAAFQPDAAATSNAPAREQSAEHLRGIQQRQTA
jgi:iron(III) transport system ATP-binding protein